MKKIINIIFYFVTLNFYSQVGLGTNSPNTSSILDLTSTTKGFLPPRMSNIEMNAINNPSEGLLVFCNDCIPKGIYLRTENSWLNLILPDASNTTKGKIQLAGDLGGTADLPTVPELANKEIIANKSFNIITDAASDTKFPSVKAIKTYVDSQLSSIQTTSNTALATADAAIGFSTLYANTYLASSTSNIVLPGYTQIDAGTGTSQTLAVSRDVLNDKKYFNLPTWNSGGKFKFLLFNNFKSDTKYAGFQIRGKGLFSFGCLLRMVPNAIPANTFQSTGYNYIYVAVGSHTSDNAYITSFTAGSGDGTSNSSADGTSAIANTPKVVIYAFDSKVPGSFRTLSVSSINTTTHPNFGSSGASSEIDIKYTIEADGANGTIAIKYKNINDSVWTTLYSYAIPSATTLGTELTSGGKAGFAFGIGNRFNISGMQEIKISSITPIALE